MSEETNANSDSEEQREYLFLVNDGSETHKIIAHYWQGGGLNLKFIHCEQMVACFKHWTWWKRI